MPPTVWTDNLAERSPIRAVPCTGATEGDFVDGVSSAKKLATDAWFPDWPAAVRDLRPNTVFDVTSPPLAYI